VLAGGAPAGLSARVVETSFRSRAVRGVVRMEVYLPADYATERHALSGRLLPARPARLSTSFRSADFLRAALDRVGRPAILVAPQGARDHDSDPESARPSSPSTSAAATRAFAARTSCTAGSSPPGCRTSSGCIRARMRRRSGARTRRPGYGSRWIISAPWTKEDLSPSAN
jgi:hypothetical protein